MVASFRARGSGCLVVHCMFYTTIGGWAQEIFLRSGIGGLWSGGLWIGWPLAGAVEDSEDEDFGWGEAVDRDEGGARDDEFAGAVDAAGAAGTGEMNEALDVMRDGGIG